MGVGVVPGQLTSACSGRWCSMVLRTRGLGPMRVASFYGIVGAADAEQRAELVEMLGGLVGGGLPFVSAGDYNAAAGRMARRLEQADIQATVLSLPSSVGMCWSSRAGMRSNIDFFVADTHVAAASGNRGGCPWRRTPR